MEKGTYIESKYIDGYCQFKKFKHFIIRLDHYTNGWYMVSGFLSAADTQNIKHETIFDKLKRKNAPVSVTNNDIKVEKEVNFDSGIFSDDSYSCPYCGNNCIVKCGGCGIVCCNTKDAKFFKCKCGHSGEISGRIQSLRTINNGVEKMKVK